MKSKFKNTLFVILLLVIFVLLLSIFYGVYKTISNSDSSQEGRQNIDSDFKYKMIKEVNKNYHNTNYLISPYSIEVALSMVREGASSSTLEELENVVPERYIEDIRIKNRVNVANALFIKDVYKDNIKLDYKKKMKSYYDSEILIDKYDTPKVINNWVKKETDGMIDKIIEEINPEFVLGIANAVALDVDWYHEFECSKTHKDSFIINDKSIDVAMMNNSLKNNASYFDNSDASGVILPYVYYDKDSGKADYDKDSQLEFIGILPKIDINTYISAFNKNNMEEIYNNKRDADKDLTINVKLPRFSYSFDYSTFLNSLKNMGLVKMFESSADFGRLSDIDLYVDKAVHKTFIDLNEKGTKAAAVTYFGFDKNAIDLDENVVDISFNKPFIYMIKYKDEIIFFGVVVEPEKWTNKTIACKE